MKLLLWIPMLMVLGFWLFLIAVTLSVSPLFGSILIFASAIGGTRFYLDMRRAT